MTIRQTVENVKNELQAAGVEIASQEVRFLVEGLCRLSRGDMFLHSDMVLTDDDGVRIQDAVRKRKAGWPLQYLIGEWEFYGYPIIVGEGVLIPRPETEVLVREALEAVSTIKNPAVADLCSGSGCIAIAIARERADARVTAVEKYDDAYAFLERNLERNEVKNVLPIKADALGEFSQSLEGAFDLIVCNPPYIKTSDMRTLQREVRFEPSEALDGRQDGLYFYREITRRWMPCLTAGGRLIYETGYDQGAAVSEILQTNGFEQVGITRDYNDIDRVVYGTCTTVPTMTQER